MFEYVSPKCRPYRGFLVTTGFVSHGFRRGPRCDVPPGLSATQNWSTTVIFHSLRVNVLDGIILDSYGEADTRCDEYSARGHGGLRTGDRARSPRATENRYEGILRLLDTLRGSSEHEYMSGMPWPPWCAAGVES